MGGAVDEWAGLQVRVGGAECIHAQQPPVQ